MSSLLPTPDTPSQGSSATDRYAICQACPFLFKPTRQCNKCKCFMPLKVRVASASCPIGKW